MNLQTYCENNGGTALRGCPVLDRVAADAGCSAATLYMIAKGHKNASAILAGRIEQASAGQVTRFDLRPDVFGEPPTKPAEQGAESPKRVVG